jgi:hypothetical protein
MKRRIGIVRIQFDIVSMTQLNVNEVSDLEHLVIKTWKTYRQKNNCGEGLFELDDGTLHFFTYKLRDDLVMEVVLGPRQQAEAILNRHGLSTYELFD